MTTSLITKGNPFATEDLQDLIQKGLTQKVKVSRQGGRLYAGDAGHCSRRAVALGKPGLEGTSSASSAFYMAIGSAAGDIITDALFNQGVLCFKEYKLPDIGFNLGGYIDAIVALRGKIIGVENKTCGELPTSAKDEHKAQAQVYSLATGLPFKLLYLSRSVADWSGRLKMAIFDVPTTEDDLIPVARSVATAFHYYQAGYLPERPAHFKKSKHCGFCPFERSCWDDGVMPFPPPDKEMRAILDERIDASVANLMATRASRRNGVLKHLSESGNPAAIKLLRGTDWSLV